MNPKPVASQSVPCCGMSNMLIIQDTYLPDVKPFLVIDIGLKMKSLKS